MMENDRDREILDCNLSLLDSSIDVQRLQRVRRSIIFAADAKPQFSFLQLFQMRPALLMATGLLGLILGASLPADEDDGNAMSYLTFQPQTFLGDFG